MNEASTSSGLTLMAIKSPHIPTKPSLRCTTIAFTLTLLLTSLLLFLYSPVQRLADHESFSPERFHFSGDLREARIAWNQLRFGRTSEKLRVAVFSRKWPAGATPGGMERHAFTLYSDLAGRGHEVHVYTAPSDKHARTDTVVDGNLHVHFAANTAGTLNYSLMMELFEREVAAAPFDYVHTESVSLPHWRAMAMPNVAVTWHGIWYEIMHSTLFEHLLWPAGGSDKELREAMPKLANEIRFFSRYTHHICISHSAGDILVNIYQLPPSNVHVILNGVDQTRFVHDPASGTRFRDRYGFNSANVSLVMGVAGRLVKDKGHPLLYEAFSLVQAQHPGVLLLVAGSGPWANRYKALGPNVKVLGPLGPVELAEFYNAVDVFVNPTLRPQGLDLTLMEAMACAKPVLTTNFPSIRGTAVMHDGLGYLFSPNVRSLEEALERAIVDGPQVLKKKGMACKAHALSMFTATQMASAYERFFLCMKNRMYCRYPLAMDS